MRISDAQRGVVGEHRRSFLRKAGLAAGAAWVAPTILSSPAGAQSGTPVCSSCGSELVVDGDGTSTAAWAQTGSPDVEAVVPPGVFRAGGSSGTTSSMQQVIDLVATPSTACGGRGATFSARLRSGLNTSGQAVTSSVATLQWYDGLGGTGNLLSTITLTSTTNTLDLYSDVGTVPAGAVSAIVSVALPGRNQATNRGLADDVSLEIAC